MSKLTERFVLRLTPTLRRRLEDAASVYHRSLNSEILARLEQSLGGFTDDAADPLHSALIEELERMLRAGMNADELQCLRGFKRLPDAKQRALLELLS
jgi:hypothetical protein